MTQLQVTYRKTGDLIPYARNARTHSQEQVQRIAASINEFGFTNPILVDGDNGIIAGHGRLAAAQLLKMDEVPTIELSGMSETQKRAYILADNKLALDAGWDDAFLGLELQDLKASDVDLELTGFSIDEIDQLIGGEMADLPELSDEDDVKQLTITLNPTHDEFDTIQEAIKKAKELYGIKGMNNAPIVCQICRDWINVHG